MPVKDYDLFNQIDRIADHMEIVLNNAFIRNALAKVELPFEYQNGVDILLSRSESYKLNGYMFDELYRGVIGLAMWVYRSRTEILPILKYRLLDSTLPNLDKVREQMAVDNLNSNLGILADEVNNLYVKTVQADKDSHSRKAPVYERMNDLKNIGQLLTSDTHGLLR